MSDPTIRVVDPDSTEKEALTKHMNLQQHPKAPLMDYNAVAAAYNAAPVGAVLLIEDMPPPYQIRNLTMNLHNRGIRPRVDFQVSRVSHSRQGKKLVPAERPIGILKRTDRKARIIEKKNGV